jgi:hypothetical protein
VPAADLLDPGHDAEHVVELDLDDDDLDDHDADDHELDELLHLVDAVLHVCNHDHWLGYYFHRGDRRCGSRKLGRWLR